MNPLRYGLLVLCIVFANAASAALPDVDTSLSNLASNVAKHVKEQQKKKVAVVDFHDFQGTTQGELGKYIAEQLTVNLVLEKREFSVLDRANLRRILAEHKLTSQGLIDPENAKKLGSFAGVDALVLGTIIPKSTNSISLNAKIITTDTAEIIGAARTEFAADDMVQQLVSKPSSAGGEGAAVLNANPAAPPRAPQKPFGELQVYPESFRYSETPGERTAMTTLRFVITNTSSTITYGVAYVGNPYSELDLVNSRGDDFHGVDVEGIEAGSDYPGSRHFTDIPPKSAVTVRARNQIVWRGKSGDYRPYRFEWPVVFAEENQGRYSNMRKHIVTIEIK